MGWLRSGSSSLFRFLTTSNLTTNEDIKGAYSNKRGHSNFNPFSAGNAVRNCNEILCGPLNPSLIDARGYVTEDYLISVTSPPTQPPPPQQSQQQMQQQVQAPPSQQQAEPQVPKVEQEQSSVTSVVEKRLPNSATAPEMQRVSMKLPPIKQSSTAQNLTLTNVGLHNEGQENEKMDLDQTTMIGSALDLDSLASEEEAASEENCGKVRRHHKASNGATSSHAGSQVGLLKLSAVWSILSQQRRGCTIYQATVRPSFLLFLPFPSANANAINPPSPFSTLLFLHTSRTWATGAAFRSLTMWMNEFPPSWSYLV